MPGTTSSISTNGSAFWSSWSTSTTRTTRRTAAAARNVEMGPAPWTSTARTTRRTVMMVARQVMARGNLDCTCCSPLHFLPLLNWQKGDVKIEEASQGSSLQAALPCPYATMVLQKQRQPSSFRPRHEYCLVKRVVNNSLFTFLLLHEINSPPRPRR